MVLATVLLSAWTQAWLLYLGLLFMVMVTLAPDGLAGIAQAHLRVMRQGRWRPLLPGYLTLWASASLALAGSGALVEMVYRLQLQAVQGDTLRYLGREWNVSQAASWLTAAAMVVAGGVPFMVARKRFARLLTGGAE